MCIMVMHVYTAYTYIYDLDNIKVNTGAAVSEGLKKEIYAHSIISSWIDLVHM